MPARRRFGSVRRRDSGRWQARYRGPDGQLRSAPHTFERKSDAERFLSLVEAQIMRGEWLDPERQKVRLVDYAERWIAERPGLRPRTVELYEMLLRKHIAPYIGGAPLGKITTPLVREWRAQLLRDGRSQSTTAKAYRLLRAVLMTAVKEDHILARNPCRVKGADQETPEERPVLTPGQVFRLADAVRPRYRALVLFAAFTGLRYGELAALRRSDIDLNSAVVTVVRAYVEQKGKGPVIGPPKSRAGRRRVGFPRRLVPILVDHMAEHVGPGHDALVFAGPKGAVIRRSNFRRQVGWKSAVEQIGVPALHFHDLRHTGNMLAARANVSTRDLMDRMGHDSMRAALMYQHGSDSATRTIADALDVHMDGLNGAENDAAVAQMWPRGGPAASDAEIEQVESGP